MESSSLQNGNGRGRRHKEEDGVVPTSPSRPSSAPRRVVRAPKCPRSFSPRENRRKGANLPHQRTLAPSGRVSPPGGIEQTGGKTSSYRPAVSSYRQAVRNRGTWLALGWRLTGGLFRLALALCRQRFLLTFSFFSLLFRVTH